MNRSGILLTVSMGVLLATGLGAGQPASQQLDPREECEALSARPPAEAPETRTTGSFSYALHSVHWGQEKLAGPAGPVNVDVLYVDVEARNNSKEPLAVPRAQVQDEQGQKTSFSLKSYLRECSFTSAPLAPGGSKRAYFVFDVPAGMPYTLLLYGSETEAGEQDGEVSLPLP